MVELKCIENIIPDLELIKFQNIGVQKVLLNKKMLLAFDTGTGKTFTYALIVRALLNRNPEKKHVFIIIHDSIEQAPRDISNLVSAPVSAFSARMGQYSQLKNAWDRSSVIVMTYQCFAKENMIKFLYDRLPDIESFVIDEAHHVSNWDTSDIAFNIRSLCHFIPYVVALTATPMTSRSQQYYQILNIIDRGLSPRRDETALGKYSERYFPVNRADYGIKGKYRTTLEIVKPTPNQVGDIKGIVSRVVKGTGAVNQVDTLVRVIKTRLREGKQIIVYINYHDTREWVEQHLLEEKIRFVSLHGRITKSDERKQILNSFATGEVSVLLTSISESLNIDSDVVVFYEFTTKLKQVMGRAHRGLDEKELELVFIITKDTAEVEFFDKYIYQRSLTMQKLLQKDYSEFIKVGEEIQKLSIAQDDF